MMEDHGPAIRVVTWFLLVVSGGVVGTRIVTKWMIVRQSVTDAVLTLAALLCNVAAGVAVSIAAEHGLGQSPDALTDKQLVSMQKAIYVSEIFYVLTLCLAKLSLIALLYFLSQLTSHAPAVLAIGGAILIWAVTSIFAVLFQCRTPDVWNVVSGSCIDTRAFWRYFGVMNILFEISLFAVLFFIIYLMTMNLKKKLVIIGCFSVRIVDITVTGIQLKYTNAFSPQGLPPHSSLSIELWPWFMCGQVLQTVALISACMPYLREFLEAFPSGMFHNESRRHGLNYVDAQLSFVNKDVSGTESYTLSDFSQKHTAGSMPVTKTTISAADRVSATRNALSRSGSRTDPTPEDEMAINVSQTVHVSNGPGDC